MMKRAPLVLVAVAMLTAAAHATTPGTDIASNATYSDGWVNGDDGGTAATFNPWSLTNNNGGSLFAGYIIDNSTDGGSGDINTAGVSFGMYANPANAFANASRVFDTALLPGQTFSFDIAVNFTDGEKGFSLFAGGNQVFNFNVGGGPNARYSINQVDTGLTYSATSVFHLEFAQTAEGGGSYSVSRGSSSFTGQYAGSADSFNFYISSSSGGDENNLYFNNLVVTAIPEPSTVSLLAASAVFGACFYARRRRS